MDHAISVRQRSARDDRSRDGCGDAGANVSLLTSVEEWGAARLRAEWEHVVDSSDDRLVLFQSPEWFDHVLATAPAVQLSLACVRDGGGRVIGIVPLVRTRHDLVYSIKRARLGKCSLSLLEIPGGVPPLPEDVGIYDQLFELLRQAASDHDGLYLRMVPTSSFFWRYLNESPLVRASFAVYLPEGLSRNHAIELPQSFQEYLSHFRSKKRRDLQRCVRQMRERGGGELRLRRFEATNEVAAFLESAAPVARLSWQARCTDDRVDTTPFWNRKLTDLAERGLLRAYVLKAGTWHCAFLLGYQGRGTFHLIQIGYDPALAHYSPGAVLHYLLFEDLILHRPPRRVSFGYGDSEYKRTFGNVHFEEAVVFLVNRRLISKLKVGSYTAFKSLSRIAKRWIRGSSPSGMGPAPREAKGQARSSSHVPSA